jgi:hypothetical protein
LKAFLKKQKKNRIAFFFSILFLPIFLSKTYTHNFYFILMSYSLKPENKAWHQIVFGAGSAAGTTAAVVSEESMKCLRYCVSWVQYALKYLSQQMGFLRDYLVSLATNNKNKTMVLDSKNKQDQHVLLSIKRNMVGTIRKVIDIITVHASTALPYQAKAAVRRTILSLPNRWVNGKPFFNEPS